MAFLSVSSRKEHMNVLVPVYFLDRYMPEANGEFVKVYLYILKSLYIHDSRLSVSGMADALNHTENDILRALKYWEKLKLFRISYDSAGLPINIEVAEQYENDDIQSESVDIYNFETDTDEESSTVSLLTGKCAADADDEPQSLAFQHTSFEQTEIKQNEPLNSSDSAYNEEALSQLFFVIQQYMGRPLSSSECEHVEYWLDMFSGSTDIVEYLAEYCIGNNHSNISYMEKTALNWHKMGLLTLSDIKNHTSKHDALTFDIMKSFGISDRNPGTAEKTFIDKWKRDPQLTKELILYACEKTLIAIQKPSFPYANSILSAWKKNGISNLSDALKADKDFKQNFNYKSSSAKPLSKNGKPSDGISKKASNKQKNRFHNFRERSYDREEYEAMIYGFNSDKN